MSLESSLGHASELLMLVDPLVLHLGLEVLADFEIIHSLHEDSLDKDLVDVFEVYSVNTSLISLNFVVAQNTENVSVLY